MPPKGSALATAEALPLVIIASRHGDRLGRMQSLARVQYINPMANLCRNEHLQAASLCIIDVGPMAVQMECEIIRSIRMANPGVAIVALCTELGGDGNRFAQWTRAGATHVLLLDAPDVASEIRRVVDRYVAPPPDTIDVLATFALGLVGTSLAKLVLSHRPTPGTSSAAAQLLGLNVRRLNVRLRAEGIRSAKHLISLTMVVHLILCLRVRGAAFERTAYDVGYNSALTARRHIEKATGLSVEEVRTAISLVPIVEKLSASLRRRGD